MAPAKSESPVPIGELVRTLDGVALATDLTWCQRSVRTDETRMAADLW
jgi:hypothetical protein